MKTIIYGASDDLLEIDGHFSEELSIDSDEKSFIGVSDGTLLSVEYDGEWKFRLERKGLLFKEIIQSVGEDFDHEGENKKYTSYSDLVVFEGDIKWVVLGTKSVKN